MTEVDRRKVDMDLGHGRRATGVCTVEVDEVSLASMIRKAILSSGKQARAGAVYVRFRGAVSVPTTPTTTPTTTSHQPNEAAAGAVPADGGCPPAVVGEEDFVQDPTRGWKAGE